MKIVVSGIHLKENPQIEDYAAKKVKKLQKFHPKIGEIKVRLISKPAHRGKEKDYFCEITIHVPGKILEIIDSERAMDKAIDKALERAKRALTKHKEKIVDKKRWRAILGKLRSRLPW